MPTRRGQAKTAAVAIDHVKITAAAIDIHPARSLRTNCSSPLPHVEVGYLHDLGIVPVGHARLR